MHKYILNDDCDTTNYFTECEKLKDVVNSQKIIIARLEKEINTHKHTILSLAQQLSTKNNECSVDLLSFD